MANHYSLRPRIKLPSGVTEDDIDDAYYYEGQGGYNEMMDDLFYWEWNQDIEIWSNVDSLPDGVSLIL